MTAKPTLEEMDGIEHHLIDYLDANEEPNDFVDLAVWKIKLIQKRRKIPILVGGSISLTEPLLFHPFVRGLGLSFVILDSDVVSLGSRLDARVDQMVGQGLLEEVRRLYKLERELLESEDCSRDVWKAIGYPELRPCCEVEENSPQCHRLVAAGLCYDEGEYRSLCCRAIGLGTEESDTCSSRRGGLPCRCHIIDKCEVGFKCQWAQ